MKMEDLSKQVKEIKMPEEMQERIIRNCYIEMEESTMSKNKTNGFFKRPMVAVASLALCLCLTGVTALAATGKLQGFFKDIVGWNGAVTGTSYEQATDEIELSVVSVTDSLTVEAEFVNPNVAPYMVFDNFGIEKYQIIDGNGDVVVNGETTVLTEIIEGKVNIILPIEELASGNYRLVVTEFVGSAKADQPLVISGEWECEFTR